MNKEELEELLKYLHEEEVERYRTPSGSYKEIRKWIDGFSACADMVYQWYEERTRKEEPDDRNINGKYDDIINSVDAGRKKQKEESEVKPTLEFVHLEEPAEEDVWTDEEMKGAEDKENICRLLGQLLAHTRAGENITSIEYRTNSFGDEIAKISWIDGRQKLVNITADSGLGIIKDVAKAIG